MGKVLSIYREDFYSRVPVSPDATKRSQLIYSDIASHLPVIEYYASLCDHCVEFGVRDGNSTVALLSGCQGVVESWDVNPTPIYDTLTSDPHIANRWKFHRGSTIDPDLKIPETDLIFFDTLHTYDHLSAELAQHGRRSKKFLLFHDTETCGVKDVSGENPRAPGIMPAIEEFVGEYYGEYATRYQTTFCNGLLVLERLSR